MFQVPENYKNCGMFIRAVDINSVLYRLTGDFKMFNIGRVVFNQLISITLQLFCSWRSHELLQQTSLLLLWVLQGWRGLGDWCGAEDSGQHPVTHAGVANSNRRWQRKGKTVHELCRRTTDISWWCWCQATPGLSSPCTSPETCPQPHPQQPCWPLAWPSRVVEEPTRDPGTLSWWAESGR